MNITSVTSNPALKIDTFQQPDNKAAAGVQKIGETFEQTLQSLSKSQNDTNDLIEKLAAGEDVDIHQVMISSEETDINFRIAMAIRDKLVDAYKEISRMSV